MEFNSITKIFNAFNRLRVLIIGDVMIDRYINGTVSRISPEAPVPIVDVNSREDRLGGAANVALNIAALGATPVLCSVIGDDDAGSEMIEQLSRNNIDSQGIIKSPNRSTTVKNRIISKGHQLLRFDEEVTDPLNEIDHQQLKANIQRLVKDCDVIIFEDYDKSCINEDIIQSTIEQAKALGIPTAADPKVRNFHAYINCTLFKPNLIEMKRGLNMTINPTMLNDLDSAAMALKSKMSFDWILMTLSELGVYYFTKKKGVKQNAHLRKVSDVSGAGDTVISIAALGLALELPIEITAELANLGGGIVCEYPGVVPIPKQRLEIEANNTVSLTAHMG
ncbi:MAG: D-glycero-beta-D-manno-heptose-7-phosphate kinase [Cyclobacteriaceae bacterium]